MKIEYRIADVNKKGLKCRRCGICCMAKGITLTNPRSKHWENLKINLNKFDVRNIVDSVMTLLAFQVGKEKEGRFEFCCRFFWKWRNLCIVHKIKPRTCEWFPFYDQKNTGPKRRWVPSECVFALTE